MEVKNMKKFRHISVVVLTLIMTAVMAIGVAACDSCGQSGYDIEKRARTGWKDEKVYTYNSYITAIPSLWNELASTDGGDRDIMDFLNSSFFEFDFEFDESGEVVSGGFEVEYSAATKLEDATADYKGKYGIPEDDEEGHRAWRITLRDDLKWDDGTAITADDFVYTMEKQLNGKYLFDQAANYWNGNYILHNAQNYFYEGRTVWLDANTPYGGYTTDMDDKLIFSLGSAAENEKKYESSVCALRNILVEYQYIGAKWTAAQVAGCLINDFGAETTSEAILALEGKTLAQIKADATLKATWDAVYACWVDNPATETLNFFLTHYTYDEMEFNEVGIVAESDTKLVVIYDNANLSPINADGSLNYQAAYYFSGLPLVKKDLWEKLEVEPANGSTVYTTNYNALTVANSASWGPYKLSNYQAGTTYTLSRNDKWYGYGMDKYDDQYQTDNIVVRQIAEWNTAWQAFQKGEFSVVSIDTTIADEFRNSKRAYYTPTSGVATYFLQCNEDALTKEKGNALLKYKDFRKAFSLALDRAEYCQKLTTSSIPSLGLYNDLIYYDVANGGVYRHETAAKEVLLSTYGAEKQTDGKWKVGTQIYDDIDDAMDALTGYNLDLAKQLFTSAYNDAKEAGDIDENGKVTIRYGGTENNENMKKEINFMNDALATATVGTPLEGKITVEFYEFNAANWIDDFRYNGMYDIASAYVSGGAWNPYYSLQIYLLDSQRLTIGWDTSAEMLEFTVPAGGEGQPAITDKLSLVDWFYCLNGLTGCKYNISLYPTDSKLALTAALEGAILESYTSIPVNSITSSSLMSYKCEYITYEYNTFMSYGGVRYMSYNFDDTEWTEWVKAHKGTLDYRF